MVIISFPYLSQAARSARVWGRNVVAGSFQSI